MAKIIGISIAIFSFMSLLGQLFLYQNSSAYLTYNPLVKTYGLTEVGLIMPVVMSVIFFIIGYSLFIFSDEPESY